MHKLHLAYKRNGKQILKKSSCGTTARTSASGAWTVGQREFLDVYNNPEKWSAKICVKCLMKAKERGIL